MIQTPHRTKFSREYIPLCSPLIRQQGKPAVTALCASKNRPYWSQDDDEDDENENDEYFDEDYDPYYTDDDDDTNQQSPPPAVFEWEVCETTAGTVHVLLPPSSVQLPSVVFHFTGGTFFGSAPNIWYRKLLEDLARHTQAAIVATSIPVTLMRSPLQHVSLAKKLQKQFQVSWRDVLIDEYGEDIQSVPICGMGHSLGARLMTILATLGDGKQSQASSSRRAPVDVPSYKAFVLLSFINNRAEYGIPGLKQLLRASRKSEKFTRSESQQSRQRQSRRRTNGLDDDEYDDEYDDDDEDDEDWGEIFGELQSRVSEKAARVKAALTPSSEDLEFYPTPKQLWEALGSNSTGSTDGGRYNIPATLVVQFDDDVLDQSSKLATTIVGSSDVKFARLRGTHLTPVSPNTSSGNSKENQFTSGAGKLVWRLLSGSQARSTRESFLELRQSIVRYTMDVVIKIEDTANAS
jgi:hypothetical protein